MMKVEILEETGVKHAGVHYASGDHVTVSDELGRMFCGAGWARDLADEVETGERKTDGSNVTLAVDSGVLESVAGDAG